MSTYYVGPLEKRNLFTKGSTYYVEPLQYRNLFTKGPTYDVNILIMQIYLLNIVFAHQTALWWWVDIQFGSCGGEETAFGLCPP